MLDDIAHLQRFQRRRIAEGVSETARWREQADKGFLEDLLGVVKCPEALQGQENGHASAAAIFFTQTVLPLISSHTSHLDVNETLQQIRVYLEEDVHYARNTVL